MKRVAVVLGIAPCLEEDLAALLQMSPFADMEFFAVGLDCSDRVFFHIQHACSYHPNEFEDFKLRRKKIGGNLDYVAHSHKQPADKLWPLVAPAPRSGSSSFLAVQVALGLGFQKIVLCGCPMQGANYDPKKKMRYDTFQAGWVEFGPVMFGNRVRSMNGWTQEFLGAPTEEWLNE